MTNEGYFDADRQYLFPSRTKKTHSGEYFVKSNPRVFSHWSHRLCRLAVQHQLSRAGW